MRKSPLGHKIERLNSVFAAPKITHRTRPQVAEWGFNFLSDTRVSHNKPCSPPVDR